MQLIARGLLGVFVLRRGSEKVDPMLDNTTLPGTISLEKRNNDVRICPFDPSGYRFVKDAPNPWPKRYTLTLL